MLELMLAPSSLSRLGAFLGLDPYGNADRLRDCMQGANARRNYPKDADFGVNAILGIASLPSSGVEGSGRGVT